MLAKVFEKDEQAYRKWLKTHPHGYVLTTVREINISYMSLHRASCRMISRYMKNMANNAFTGRGYIKICSLSTNNLLTWVKEHGGKGFTKVCSICAPDTDIPPNGAKNYSLVLENEILQSLGDSEGRRERLKNALKIPESFTTTTTLFKRNPDVIAETLERANGYCERCRKEAPFKRASDGSPYLEVHHRTPLSEDGEDTVENTIALCPNCHREAHYGEPLT